MLVTMNIPKRKTDLAHVISPLTEYGFKRKTKTNEIITFTYS